MTKILFERVEIAVKSHEHCESARHESGKEWARAVCQVLEVELKKIKAQQKKFENHYHSFPLNGNYD